MTRFNIISKLNSFSWCDLKEVDKKFEMLINTTEATLLPFLDRFDRQSHFSLKKPKSFRRRNDK